MIRRAEATDAEAIAQVHVASWQSTYRGIVPDIYLDNMSVERRVEYWGSILSKPLYEHELIVLEQQGQVVGFANGGPNRERKYRYDAEIYALYLLQRVQGQGYGKAMVHQLIESFSREGYRSMLVWALKDNPAVQFYERLGAKPIEQKEIMIGGIALMECALGWGDLTAAL
ncbi:GNAT family N-acetyltransferase [Paenibacillus aquistagni]|uniref:L-amino acid N-acyltransferase YncA n=1 Tax=Paenibacillus aquistagni TaxID=1852522 RepID=A0A1X7IUE4_9BACL|nr:GNAT family N-acetyltransferase [Paenibacillus aquistagni]NMM51093.1 GNAT family N-acetyltransferase [Paenibacillus aquistagni]SMG18176.1 L-amino acid N-acyltransferase YncA [Paenibacillus aquistagni]